MSDKSDKPNKTDKSYRAPLKPMQNH